MSEITAADLMSRLYAFADDSMQGRAAGTRGDVMGTDYLAREARRIGLRPAGERGTYFQTVPVRRYRVSPNARLVAAGGTLPYGAAWRIATTRPLHRADLPVVYGGTLQEGRRSLSPDAVAGKLVVYSLHGHVTMQMVHDAPRLVPGAVAVAFLDRGGLRGMFGGDTTFVDDPTSAPAGVPLLWLDESLATRLFGRSPTWLWAGSAGHAVTIDVALDTIPMRYPVRNVVAVLPGTDATLRREYVALGAHGDHVGVAEHAVDHDSLRILEHLVRPGGMEDRARQPTRVQQEAVNRQLAAYRAAHPGSARLDSIYNGADDDGSGSAALLEIAENLAAARAKPRRSLLFVWHAAEERGLWGSTYFTDHPTVARDAIVAHVGVDMLGHGDAWDVTGIAKDGRVLHGAPNYLQLVGARRSSTELGALVERVNGAGGHGLALDHSMDAAGHPAQYDCRSDHYSYARYGIPAVLFSTGGHSGYHEVTDEPQYVDYEHLARATRFIADVVARLADVDHRPRADRVRPDPRAPCRQ